VEYSFKYTASSDCKAILHSLFEKERYSALHGTAKGVCSQRRGIYIAVRLTCSRSFLCSFQLSVSLLLCTAVTVFRFCVSTTPAAGDVLQTCTKKKSQGSKNTKKMQDVKAGKRDRI